MRRVPVILICLCALLLAGCSPNRPQFLPNGVPRDENFNGGPNAILLKYDANHDGRLTRAEMAAGLKAEFDALDSKHSGCLDAAQAGAINAARIATDKSTASPLQDWNQDGCIDLKEYSTAADSLFDELDRNGDGVIAPLEFNPRPAPRGGVPARRPPGAPGP